MQKESYILIYLQQLCYIHPYHPTLPRENEPLSAVEEQIPICVVGFQILHPAEHDSQQYNKEQIVCWAES